MTPGRTPPRFVPTLTEVVRVDGAQPLAQQPAALSPEQLVHRIMQKVDLTLDRRLREAIATTVLEQTRSLGPQLREEIEAVVRDTVSQAMAEELVAAQNTAKPGL
ncbi:MAG: hypothetical protein HYX47_21220 [Burkholderiales bacterium]|nr:hypothetical protein [Burkholderiales bacterium]